MSGKIIGYGILAAQLAGAGGLSGIPTAFSIDFSDYVTYAGSAEGYVTTYSPTIWLQITDDGSHVIESYSMDGVNFNGLTNVTKSSGYLGATGYNQICIFVSAHGSDAKLILSDYD